MFFIVDSDSLNSHQQGVDAAATHSLFCQESECRAGEMGLLLRPLSTAAHSRNIRSALQAHSRADPLRSLCGA